MQDHRALGALLGTLVLAAAATAYLLVDRGGPPGVPVSPLAATGDPDRAGEADPFDLTADADGDVRVDRSALDAGKARAASGEMVVARARVEVTGRVVDARGNPIGGAEIRLLHRQSMRSMFESGTGSAALDDIRERIRDGGFAGAAGGFGGRGLGGLGGRTFDDPALEAIAARFRPAALGDAVVTRNDGSFSIAGRAFADADLLVAVRDRVHAPTVVTRAWRESDGDVQLEPIVLEDGIVVSGVVVGEDRRGIAAATVRYTPAGNGERGGEPAQAERGGFGGRAREFGGRVGNSALVASLVGAAETDASGGFSLGPLPIAPFELRADAPRMLEGRSERVEPRADQALPQQTILLRGAVALSGIVRDRAGQPIAGANVLGEVSRDAMVAQLRAERETRSGERAAATPADDGTGRRGRRGEPRADPSDGEAARGGRRGGRGGDGTGANPGDDPARAEQLAEWRDFATARDRATTDTEGRFELTELPPAPLHLRVEHPEFIDAAHEPIDPRQAGFVEIMMQPTLSVRGIVVDAMSGAPIEEFGIAARRIAEAGAGIDLARSPVGRESARGPGRGDGGRVEGLRGNRGESAGASAERGPGRGNPALNREPSAEVLAQRAANEASAASTAALRTSILTDRLGPTGRVAGRTPPATAHVDGRFEVHGLEPGDYVFDIDAPGRVKIAAGIVTLTQETGSRDGVVFRVASGTALRGRIVHGDGSPIERAEVELALPALPTVASTGSDDSPPRSERRGRGGWLGALDGGTGTDADTGPRVARERTDSEGAFELPPQQPGRYVLTIRARGIPDRVDPDFVLPAGRESHEILITMAAGGRVFGVVSGIERARGARVLLTHRDGSRHTGSIDADSGQYEVSGLPEGAYFVTVVERGSGRGDRDDLAARMVAQRARSDADVFVARDAAVRYDFDARQTRLGAVVGTVRLNGAAARGMEVRLRALTEETEPAGRGPGGTPNWSDQVGEDGSFAIENVAPGTYRLEVLARNGRTGRGGFAGFGGREPTMHRETTRVLADLSSTVHIEVTTAQLEIRVTSTANPPPSRLRVTIVSASEAGDTEPDQWRRFESTRSMPVRDGSTGTQDVLPGTYRYAVVGRGATPASGTIQVGPGAPTTVVVPIESAPESQDAPGSTPQSGRPIGLPGGGRDGDDGPAPGRAGRAGRGRDR